MGQTVKGFFYRCLVILSLLAALLLADAWLLGLLSFLGACCLAAPCLVAAYLLAQNRHKPGRKSRAKRRAALSIQMASPVPPPSHRAA